VNTRDINGKRTGNCWPFDGEVMCHVQASWA